MVLPQLVMVAAAELVAIGQEHYLHWPQAHTPSRLVVVVHHQCSGQLRQPQAELVEMAGLALPVALQGTLVALVEVAEQQARKQAVVETRHLLHHHKEIMVAVAPMLAVPVAVAELQPSAVTAQAFFHFHHQDKQGQAAQVQPQQSKAQVLR